MKLLLPRKFLSEHKQAVRVLKQKLNVNGKNKRDKKNSAYYVNRKRKKKNKRKRIEKKHIFTWFLREPRHLSPNA